MTFLRTIFFLRFVGELEGERFALVFSKSIAGVGVFVRSSSDF
jgi:hypothetical protein